MNPRVLTFSLIGGFAVYAALALRAIPDDPQSTIEQLADPVESTSAEESGTRLKAKYIAGADGSRLFYPNVLYDSELGVDCRFRTAADGEWRCLPDVGEQPIVFTDDQCAEGVVYIEDAPAGCTVEPPAYALLPVSPPYCDPTTVEAVYTKVYPVESLIAPPGSPGYRIDFGSHECVAQSVPSGRVAFALGDEIPPSEFVTGTRGIEP